MHWRCSSCLRHAVARFAHPFFPVMQGHGPVCALPFDPGFEGEATAFCEQRSLFSPLIILLLLLILHTLILLALLLLAVLPPPLPSQLRRGRPSTWSQATTGRTRRLGAGSEWLMERRAAASRRKRYTHWVAGSQSRVQVRGGGGGGGGSPAPAPALPCCLPCLSLSALPTARLSLCLLVGGGGGGRRCRLCSMQELSL